ncbi:hypothetical protein Poly21_29480 [Allorhodopirellula heiligendammensis]|uniref:Uncharacterized protein n=1 Tax=Allorhodopirellula heiligendammensis TaxID=2714739 RepID=A0A5C6BWU2_9BACT|nr:hypothetical protein Poly21_29480 [Allorhodopirellula heiligendammensis]
MFRYNSRRRVSPRLATLSVSERRCYVVSPNYLCVPAYHFDSKLFAGPTVEYLIACVVIFEQSSTNRSRGIKA